MRNQISMVLLFLLVNSYSLAQDIVIDRQFAPPSSGWSQAFDNRDIAQTFTVGLEGFLDHIDLHVNHQSNLTGNMFWDLRHLDFFGAPIESDEMVVAAGCVPVADIPDYFDETPYVLDLSEQKIFVNPGDQFALVVRTDIGNVFWLSYPPANAGEKYERSFGGLWQVDDFLPERGRSFASYVRLTPPPLLGDVNCDGDVNLLDVAPFVEIVSFGPYSEKADLNGDGQINLLDVQPFVELLSGQ